MPAFTNYFDSKGGSPLYLLKPPFAQERTRVAWYQVRDLSYMLLVAVMKAHFTMHVDPHTLAATAGFTSNHVCALKVRVPSLPLALNVQILSLR